MSLDEKTIKFKYLIEEIIKEHNKVWENISWNGRNKGYRCFKIDDDVIITIASGLARRLQ